MSTLLGSFTVDQVRRRAFLRGFASVMDLRGDTRRQYRFRRTPAGADFDASVADWQQIGDDLRAAVRQTARGLSAV